MSIRKEAAVGDLKRYDIDSTTSLELLNEGIMGCLEGESFALTSDEPETIIIIRSDGVARTMEIHDRALRAVVYNGYTMAQVIEDLQKTQA